MKRDYIILFLLITSIAFAQQLKFNHSFIASYEAAPGTVFSVDSSFYVLGPKGINNRGLLSIWKYDKNGNALWEKSYGDTISSYIDGVENSWIKLANNQFAATGDINTTIGPFSIRIALYKFDSEFDTLWMKTYLDDTLHVFARGLTKCSDGGFAIVGLSTRDEATGNPLPQYTGKGLLLRTDSLGNYLWHKTFGEWDYASELHKVVQTPDGGFLCGGATKAYSNSHNWDWYLVKTDSQGNKEWHRTYGSSTYDDTRTSGISITKDTNYVITGGKAYGGDEYRPYIVVLNKDFQTVLTKTLPYQSKSSFIGKTIELENIGYISIGGDRVNDGDITVRTLTKFDYDFNEIWRRKYTAYDTSNVDNYISSVDTCSDGGYVLGGWAAVYDGNGQRLSLIKTDSLGCDGTDWWACSTDAMVNEYVNNPDFTLFPNPVKDFINISYNIPAQAGIPSPKVKIYNMQGQLVLNSPFEKGGRGIDSQQINIEQLKPGVYFVKIGKATKKIIKE